jgi:imidazolonepropionase-like amidohydrolase
VIAIKAGKLIDGSGKVPLENAVVLVEEEKILRVGRESEVAVPPDAEVVDASDKTVMPGMIDCHVHVQGKGGPPNRASWGLAVVTELLETTTLNAYVHAKQNLAAGFTTIRDVSARGYVGVALRDAIASGLVEGPRMRACGQGLCITGGHMDQTPWRPGVTIADRTGVADSPWQFRQAARYQIKMGADCIKINISSGAHPDRHKPEEPVWQEMTLEEMKAVCDEAHKAYLRVAAHSSGGQGITDGILAGVDSMEHANWLTDEQADLMAEHGTFMVPTLIVNFKGLEIGKEAMGATEKAWIHRKKNNEAMWRALEIARRAGVKIALGTDAGWLVHHGENARELEMLVKGGMTPMEAILAATTVGAELLDMADLVGTIEPDKFADLLIVDGDPLSDTGILQDPDRIKTVMKGGKVVAN